MLSIFDLTPSAKCHRIGLLMRHGKKESYGFSRAMRTGGACFAWERVRCAMRVSSFLQRCARVVT